MHGNILYTFDYRADPVAHLFLHAHTLISLSYPQTLLFRTRIFHSRRHQSSSYVAQSKCVVN